MIKNTENRVILTACNFNFDKIPDLQENINYFTQDLSILNTASLIVRENTMSMFARQAVRYFQLELNSQAIEEFNNKYLSNKNYRLFDINIRFTEKCFVNLITTFDYIKYDINFDSIFDADSWEILDYTDMLEKEVYLLIDKLKEKKILESHEDFYNGFPLFARNILPQNEIDLWDRKARYMHNHFHIEDDELFNDIVSKFDYFKEHIQYNTYEVYNVDSDNFIWKGKFNKENDDYLNINFLLLAEIVIYSQFTYIAQLFIDILHSKHKVNFDKEYRKLINYIDEISLFIKNQHNYISSKDRLFVEMVEKSKSMIYKYEFYKDTVTNLKFMIDGFQFDKAQENNRIIQIILAAFTGLSLYSVITEIINFLSSNQISINTDLPFKAVVLSFVTIILASLIYLVNKRSK